MFPLRLYIFAIMGIALLVQHASGAGGTEETTTTTTTSNNGAEVVQTTTETKPAISRSGSLKERVTTRLNDGKEKVVQIADKYTKGKFSVGVDKVVTTANTAGGYVKTKTENLPIIGRKKPTGSSPTDAAGCAKPSEQQTPVVDKPNV